MSTAAQILAGAGCWLVLLVGVAAFVHGCRLTRDRYER